MAKQRLKELAKIIEYILLHRPDEFGLFLDSDGSLPIKELMWALHEESSWGHVRRGHFKELAHSGLQLAFSIEDSCIRPKIPPERPAPVVTPPKLLFYAVRRKAYPVVLRQGLRPAGRRYLPLATTREMALRIGRRRDEKPVPLTIHAARAHDSGHQFIGCGELLLLVKEMPVRFFSGPAPRKVAPPRSVPGAKPRQPHVPQGVHMPGSFLLDPSGDAGQGGKQGEKWRRRIRRERRRKKHAGSF